MNLLLMSELRLSLIGCCTCSPHPLAPPPPQDEDGDEDQQQKHQEEANRHRRQQTAAAAAAAAADICWHTGTQQTLRDSSLLLISWSTGWSGSADQLIEAPSLHKQVDVTSLTQTDDVILLIRKHPAAIGLSLTFNLWPLTWTTAADGQNIIIIYQKWQLLIHSAVRCKYILIWGFHTSCVTSHWCLLCLFVFHTNIHMKNMSDWTSWLFINNSWNK